MAIVKGVAADGSQDFTTLQAWENFVDSQSVQIDALIFAGGSVGRVSLAGWTHTFGANISPAPGARHDGTDGVDSAVALIDVVTNGAAMTLNDLTGRITLDGIKIVINNAAGNGVQLFNNNTVSGCLIVIKQGMAVTRGVQFIRNNANSRIINNIVIGKTTAYGLGLGEFGGPGPLVLGEMSHNTVMGLQGVFTGIRANLGTVVNAFNNYSFSWVGNFTNASNNASANTTAPGTSFIHNVTEANEFKNPQSDANLLSGSQLRDAAIDRTSVPGLEKDALGQDRVAPFDIGAIQFGAVGGYLRGRMAPAGVRRFASLVGRT